MRIYRNEAQGRFFKPGTYIESLIVGERVGAAYVPGDKFDLIKDDQK